MMTMSKKSVKIRFWLKVLIFCFIDWMMIFKRISVFYYYIVNIAIFIKNKYVI